MKRQAARIAGAAIAAGVLHAIAAGHLAARDPIAALLARRDAGVVVAAIGLVAARLFLYVIAPAWTAHLVARGAARGIVAARSRVIYIARKQPPSVD